MRLFKKKSKTNRKIDNRNQQANNQLNLSSSPFQVAKHDRVYLIDDNQHPRFLEHGKRYWEALPSLADQLSWFGQEPFSPAKTVNRVEVKDRRLPAIRRVLVSFQVGRPITKIAARVPCSPRTVYEILDELFYRWNGNMRTWMELGLVVIWDGPKINFDPNIGSSFDHFWDDAAPVFCLMCHHPIDHTQLHHRDHDSTLVQADDGRYRPGMEDHARALGHLISHFYLGGRPRPNEPNPLDDNIYRTFGGLAGKLNSRKWKDRVPVKAIIESQRWRSQPPLPVIQGRSPTRESVIQFYRDLMGTCLVRSDRT